MELRYGATRPFSMGEILSRAAARLSRELLVDLRAGICRRSGCDQPRTTAVACADHDYASVVYRPREQRCHVNPWGIDPYHNRLGKPIW